MNADFSRLRVTFVVFLCSLICHACASSPEVVSQDDGRATSVQSSSQTGAGSGGYQPIPAVVGLPPDTGRGGTYRIVPDDLLEIEVFQADELSSQERVNEDGVVVMPLIGGVEVGGMTPKQAEEKIAALLGANYLQDPQVNVFVKEYAGRNVTVSGAVKRPGVFPLSGRTTLVQAIALAEGVTDVANDDEVVIFRLQEGGSTRAYVVNLEAIQKGKLPDPVLVAEDRVIVPDSGTKVFVREVTDTMKGLISLNPLLF